MFFFFEITVTNSNILNTGDKSERGNCTMQELTEIYSYVVVMEAKGGWRGENRRRGPIIHLIFSGGADTSFRTVT